jgi:hypothetical protein
MGKQGVRRRSVRLLPLRLVLRRADRVVEQLYRRRPFSSVSSYQNWDGDLPDLVIEGICQYRELVQTRSKYQLSMSTRYKQYQEWVRRRYLLSQKGSKSMRLLFHQLSHCRNVPYDELQSQVCRTQHLEILQKQPKLLGRRTSPDPSYRLSHRFRKYSFELLARPA